MTSDSENTLSGRRHTLLLAAVSEFIATAEPVGSNQIASRHRLGIKSAMVRNMMSELEDAGYLSQPHTSAGRIPTDKAFRDFAFAVEAKPLSPADRERILNQMRSGETLEERIAIAARVLTDVTKNVGIATAMPASAQQLDHIELIALAECRV